MEQRASVQFTLNGQPFTWEGDPRRRLVDLLRVDQDLIGVKEACGHTDCPCCVPSGGELVLAPHVKGERPEGCGHGTCGNCGVLVNGEFRLSCLLSSEDVAGARVETVEGVSSPDGLHPVQRALMSSGAVQCGYCMPAITLAAKSLLVQNPSPTREEAVAALDPVLCRCTGYVKIIDSVLQAADVLAGRAQAVGAPLAGLPGMIGQSIERPDARDKVTGKLRYANDLKMPGALVARVLRSPHAHAQILAIDTSAAEQLPGVVRIFTAKDVPGNNGFGVVMRDQPVLAVDRVRFVGEAVAMIVAENEVAAREALGSIRVDYKVLPAVFDPQEALEAGAPLLHGESNVLFSPRIVKGDADSALAKSDIVVHKRYQTSFVEHAYNEQESALAYMDGETLVIHTSTQNPHKDQREVAQVLGVPDEQVRIQGEMLGGAFGGKCDVNLEPLLGVAVYHLRRPVRLRYSREESFLATTKRHPYQIEIWTGANRDGKLTAIKAIAVGDTGAYASYGQVVILRSLVHATGPYQIENVNLQGRMVFTNNSVSGAFRGFGSPQFTFAVEQQMDQLAEELGIDPLSFRLKNAVVPGSITATRQQLGSATSIVQCLEALQPAYRESTARIQAEQSPDSPVQRGVGIGCFFYGIGKTAMKNPSEAVCELTTDGSFKIYTGSTDLGQGTVSLLTLICAHELNQSPDSFEVIIGDTKTTPDCQETSASRTTYVSGNAAMLAARAMRESLLKQVAAAYETTVDDLEMTMGGVRLRSNPGVVMTFREIAVFCQRQGVPLEYHGVFDTNTTPLDPETGAGQPFDAYCYGAQLAEVEVNKETGKVKLIRLTAAHDVGKALHPLNVTGQLEGAAVMGMGMALMEEYTPVKTRGFDEFRIARASDVPEVVPIILEIPEPTGPYGAKGAGEAAMIPTAGAIANAIYDAVKVRVHRLPMNEPRVLAALANQPVATPTRSAD